MSSLFRIFPIDPIVERIYNKWSFSAIDFFLLVIKTVTFLEFDVSISRYRRLMMGREKGLPQHTNG